jgi:hypothetical protein
MRLHITERTTQMRDEKNGTEDDNTENEDDHEPRSDRKNELPGRFELEQ